MLARSAGASSPPLAALDPSIDPALEAVCLKAMAADPEDRYASCRALAEDVERWTADEPVTAYREPFARRARRWARRHRRAVEGAAASVLLALAVAILWAYHKAQIADEKSRTSTRISGLNVELTRKGADLEKSLASANLNLAMFHFERSQYLFEKEQIGAGLLWLVKSWQSAAAAGDPDWQHTARANIAAWQSHLFAVKAVFSHQDRVYAVAFSPDGKTLLTGSADKTARLWDAATGRPIGTPTEPPGRSLAVAFSPDGKTVLTGSYDNTARLWDAATGRPIGTPLDPQGHGLRRGIQPRRQGRTHRQL